MKSGTNPTSEASSRRSLAAALCRKGRAGAEAAPSTTRSGGSRKTRSAYHEKAHGFRPARWQLQGELGFEGPFEPEGRRTEYFEYCPSTARQGGILTPVLGKSGRELTAGHLARHAIGPSAGHLEIAEIFR